MNEAGSATVVALALVAVLAAISAATALVGLAYSARTQAVIAADAAALAAAPATYPGVTGQSPIAAASTVARANGARLVSCSCPVNTSLQARVVSVTTQVPAEFPLFGQLNFTATARAEFDPRQWLGP